MKPDLPHQLTDLFRALEPPPGGLAELRRRLPGEQRPGFLLRAARWGVAGAAAAAAVIVLSVQWTRDERLRLAYPDSSRPSLMRIGVVDLPTTAVSLPPAQRSRQGLVEIPVERDGVRAYWVQSLPLSPLSASTLDPELD